MFSDRFSGIGLGEIVAVALNTSGSSAILRATLQFDVTVDAVKDFGNESPSHWGQELLLESDEIGMLFFLPLGISFMMLAHRLICLFSDTYKPLRTARGVRVFLTSFGATADMDCVDGSSAVDV